MINQLRAEIHIAAAGEPAFAAEQGSTCATCMRSLPGLLVISGSRTGTQAGSLRKEKMFVAFAAQVEGLAMRELVLMVASRSAAMIAATSPTKDNAALA